MRKKNLKPATNDEVATIRITATQRAKVDRLIPEIFLKHTAYPEDIQVLIAEGEMVSEKARQNMRGNILDISFKK